MADDTATWKEGSHTELNRRLAKKKQADIRGAHASLASQGALYGGARQEREAEVGRDINETWHQGAQAIEDRAEAARQAQLGRDWQTGERVGTQGWQTGERVDTQGWQTGEREGSQTWQGQMQSQAEEAERALTSDKAYYQSYLQDQIHAGNMTEQQAAQEYQAYAMQADQQFAYSQMMSQQEYGYGMQNQQGQWDAYGQTLGFQNQAGLLGMQQGFDWQMSQSDQLWRQGMADLGFNFQYQEYQWKKKLAKIGADAQMDIAEMNQPGFWESLFGAAGSAVRYDI